MHKKYKNLLPYLLPLGTIIFVFIIASINPSITGFATKQNNDIVNAKIRIFTDSNRVIPQDSIVQVTLDNKISEMTIIEFIEKTNMPYEIKNGIFDEINYKGEGYTGYYNYVLDLKEFDLGEVQEKSEHLLKIKVYYQDKTISESSQAVNK